MRPGSRGGTAVVVERAEVGAGGARAMVVVAGAVRTRVVVMRARAGEVVWPATADAHCAQRACLRAVNSGGQRKSGDERGRGTEGGKERKKEGRGGVRGRER